MYLHMAVCTHDDYKYRTSQGRDKLPTAITTPLVNFPHRCLIVDVIDTSLSGVVLLERTSAVKFMLLADVYRCSKVHEVFGVRALVGK